jgi:hypothetical protein
VSDHVPPQRPQPGDHFTLQQLAARHPAFSVRALRHLQRTGRLAVYRVAGRILISEPELLELIAAGRSKDTGR